VVEGAAYDLLASNETSEAVQQEIIKFLEPPWSLPTLQKKAQKYTGIMPMNGHYSKARFTRSATKRQKRNGDMAI
jgi:hypothetical protein